MTVWTWFDNFILAIGNVFQNFIHAIQHLFGCGV